jgi:hypothetical protein
MDKADGLTSFKIIKYPIVNSIGYFIIGLFRTNLYHLENLVYF